MPTRVPTSTIQGMSNSNSSKTTAAFYAQAAISFGLALFSVIVGIAYLPADPWIRAFLCVSSLYLVSTAFTLAKVVRDQQESTSVASRLDQARVDKLLAEHDPFKNAI